MIKSLIDYVKATIDLHKIERIWKIIEVVHLVEEAYGTVSEMINYFSTFF